VRWSLVRGGNHDRIGVSGGRRRRLWRHAAKDGQSLIGPCSGAGHSVGTDCIAPHRRSTGGCVKRISDRVGAARHLAVGDGRARSGARVQPDVVWRSVGALRSYRARAVDIGSEHSGRAEIQVGGGHRATCGNRGAHREREICRAPSN